MNSGRPASDIQYSNVTCSKKVVANALSTNALAVTTDPVDGYVLTSDDSGNASWQPSSGGEFSPTLGDAVTFSNVNSGFQGTGATLAVLMGQIVNGVACVHAQASIAANMTAGSTLFTVFPPPAVTTQVALTLTIGISFAASIITIDTDGNVSINQNLTSGSTAANILTFQLHYIPVEL